jgi:RNA repair pathway DNA polymerase beta family protein
MVRATGGGEDVNMLATIRVGSRLYGTSTPTSDDDLRSVYLPSASDCFLGRVQHSIDVPDEDDSAIMSLQSFCGMALEGQSMALEMLHAPRVMRVAISPVWEELCKNRARFYTKRMAAFMSFSRSMSARYGLRIDRLKEAEAIMDVLMPYRDTPLMTRLSNIWDKLPSSLNAVKGENPANKHADKRVYTVCGRELQATISVEHALAVVGGIVGQFGERVRNAKEGKLDYKALSHAFRVTLQAKEIVTTGDLVFPLRDAEWLRAVRLGQVDFFEHSLDKRLDDLIAEVQGLMDASDLPDKPDVEWVESLIVDTYHQQMSAYFA